MSKYLLLRSMLVGLIFTVSANGQDASPLTLSRVVSLYIERNLELQAERYRLERTRADAIAARMRPNPGLSVVGENLRVSGPVPASRLYELGATDSETIELGERLEDVAVAKQSVSGEVDLRLLNPDLAKLIETALRERPDVQAAQREVEAAKDRIALEEARGKADISPFVGYKRLADDNTVMVGVNVPLKVRDQNQAGIARAQADQKAARALLEVAKSHTTAEVKAAYEAFQTARGQVQTFRDELLNQADESRSIALVAYQEGATPLLSVLEAQRTRADVRQQYFRTLFDYQVSLSELYV